MKKQSSAFFEKVLLAIAILFFSLFLCGRIYVIFLSTADTGGLEYELIYEIQRIIEGLPLYTDPFQPPFHITQKTPIYHFLIAGLAKLSGVSANEVFELYLISRIFTGFIVLSVGLVAYKIGQFFFKSSLRLSTTFSFFCMMILGHSHHYYSRMDALYTLLFLSFFYCAIINKWRVTKKTLILYSTLSILIFYVKQQGLAVIPFFGLCLLFNRQSFSGLVGYGIFSLGIILLLPFFMGQDYELLYRNIVVGVQNGIDFGYLKDYLNSEYQQLFNLITILFFFFLLQKKKDTNINFLLILTILTFSLGLITGMKAGAGNNYFTEYKILALLLVMVGYSIYQEQQSTVNLVKKILCLVFLILIGIMALKDNPWFNSKEEITSDYKSEQTIARYIQPKIENKNDLIYIKTQTFLENLLFKKSLLPTYSVFKLSLGIDDTPARQNLQQVLDSQKLKFIITKKEETFNPEIISGYHLEDFQLDTIIGNFSIYQSIKSSE